MKEIKAALVEELKRQRDDDELLQFTDQEKKQFDGHIKRVLGAKSYDAVINVWMSLSWDAPEAIRFVNKHVKGKNEKIALLGRIGLTYDSWDT